MNLSEAEKLSTLDLEFLKDSADTYEMLIHDYFHFHKRISHYLFKRLMDYEVAISMKELGGK